ncbi:hypothetical protein HAX54_002819, partial [Datura stramonium]|nr:hypothetical protein [Datura stramonium]
LDEWVLCKIYKKSDMNNTMFTQRKRSREYDEVLSDGQLDNSCNENLRNHQVVCDTLSKGASEYSLRHGRNDMSNNDATTFHPQVATRFSNFPQSSHMPTYCNMSWSTTSDAYDSQSCASQLAPSPVMIEPISSVRATNSEGFGISCFTSSIGGSYIGQECYGVDYFGNEQKMNSNDDQCDSMDCVDQYLVTNYEMNSSTMYLPEYNKENLVNRESSKSKGDC